MKRLYIVLILLLSVSLVYSQGTSVTGNRLDIRGKSKLRDSTAVGHGSATEMLDVHGNVVIDQGVGIAYSTLIGGSQTERRFTDEGQGVGKKNFRILRHNDLFYFQSLNDTWTGYGNPNVLVLDMVDGEVMINTATDAGAFPFQVNGTIFTNGLVQAGSGIAYNNGIGFSLNLGNSKWYESADGVNEFMMPLARFSGELLLPGISEATHTDTSLVISNDTVYQRVLGSASFVDLDPGTVTNQMLRWDGSKWTFAPNVFSNGNWITVGTGAGYGDTYSYKFGTGVALMYERAVDSVNFDMNYALFSDRIESMDLRFVVAQTYVGFEAGLNSSEIRASLVGYRAGKFNTGSTPVALGYKAMEDNTGNNTVAVGYSTLEQNTGDNCVGFGTLSLQYNQGQNNTALGYSTSNTNPFTLFNTTALGYNAEPDASNQVMLGDLNITEVKTAGGYTAATLFQAGSGIAYNNGIGFSLNLGNSKWWESADGVNEFDGTRINFNQDVIVKGDLLLPDIIEATHTDTILVTSNDTTYKREIDMPTIRGYGDYYFQDSSITIAMVQNGSYQITNATKTLWTERYGEGMNMSGDTIYFEHSGMYSININLSFSGVNNETWIVRGNKNGTEETVFSQRYTSSNDTGNMTSIGIISVTGDDDWLVPLIKNITDNDDATVKAGAIVIQRVD